jgi:glutamate---methylamine ligase
MFGSTPHCNAWIGLPLGNKSGRRLVDCNSVLRESLGTDLISSYLKLKYQEWHTYSAQISVWESENTLDC